MGHDPPDGGPWLAEFQPPALDFLMDQPSALDPDSLAQWLTAGPAQPARGPASGDDSLQLTSKGGSSGTITKSLYEEERLEKARAQNRAKQARFRQRQKERKERLAVQYEATAADLEREQLLNESMKLSCAALEALKSQKDMVVEVLQAAVADDQPVLAKGQCQSPGQHLQVVATADKRLSISGPGGVLSEHMWSLPFRERVGICCRTFCQTQPAFKALKAEVGENNCKPDGFSLTSDLKKQLAQQLSTHHPQLLDAALAVSPEVLVKEWGYLGELSAEVVEMYEEGKIDENGVEEHMCDTVMYFAILTALLLTHKPATLQRLLDHTKLPGESEEAAVTRWHEVAVGMGVSEEETRRMLPAFQTHMERSEQLGAATAASLDMLREVQQHMNQQMALDMGLSAAVQQYLSVFDAAGSLAHHSNAALLMTMDFMSTVGRYVTPLQKTRMMALCRPLHPDVVTIVREGLDHYGLLPAARQAAATRPSIAPPVATYAALPPDEQRRQC